MLRVVRFRQFERRPVDREPIAAGLDAAMEERLQECDLADFTTARFIQTTGQSGNPLSKHYADLMPLWRAVEYVPMYWGKERLLADGVTFTLTLEPAELAGK